jgi:hypothetical protein
MTSGSRLEMVDSPRSVGRFHSVWAYSGVFQALSLCVCVCVLRASLVVRWTMPRLVFGQVASWCLVLAATSTTRNLEIYDIYRVTFNDGVIDLTYLWWYMKVCHRILVDSRAYQNGWHFYDDSSIYCHKLKWEIITDLLQAYDESSIITIWNK